MKIAYNRALVLVLVGSALLAGCMKTTAPINQSAVNTNQPNVNDQAQAPTPTTKINTNSNQAVGATTGWKTCTNDYLTVKYPADWLIWRGAQGEGSVVASCAGLTAIGFINHPPYGSQLISIFSEQTGSAYGKINKIEDYTNQMLAQKGENGAPVHRFVKKMSIDGEDAVMIETISTIGPYGQTTVVGWLPTVYLMHRGIVYVVGGDPNIGKDKSIIYDSQSFEKAKASLWNTINQMLPTIKFK